MMHHEAGEKGLDHLILFWDRRQPLIGGNA